MKPEQGPDDEAQVDPSDQADGSPEDQGDVSTPIPEAPEHRNDGLDLARALTRSMAKSTPMARKKRKYVKPVRGRVSGSHPDERDPQLLDTTVGRLVENHGWDVDLRVHGVFGRWAELVGSDIAEHCTPESFADGKLTVRTDSTAWATQLRLLAPTVVRRLNQELGHGTVVLIEVLGPHLPTWKKGPRSVRDGRGPRDTYG